MIQFSRTFDNFCAQQGQQLFANKKFKKQITFGNTRFRQASNSM